MTTLRTQAAGGAAAIALAFALAACGGDDAGPIVAEVPAYVDPALRTDVVDPRSGNEFGQPATVPGPDGDVMVEGAIKDKWLQAGGLDGPLKKALSASEKFENGVVVPFSGGNIYYSSATGAHVVTGGILRVYTEEMGGPEGALGFPISDEKEVDGGWQNDFQHGTVSWTNQDGVYRPTVLDAMGEPLAASAPKADGSGTMITPPGAAPADAGAATPTGGRGASPSTVGGAASATGTAAPTPAAPPTGAAVPGPTG
jgi:hypothetical protein